MIARTASGFESHPIRDLAVGCLGASAMARRGPRDTEPMSEVNVATFRRAVSAVNSGDLEAWLATMHPEVRFAPISAAIEGAYRGHDGVRNWFRDNRESFEFFRVRHTDVRDLGSHRLLAVGVIELRAKESGIEPEVPTAAIATWQDGLLIDWKDYGDPKRALEAAGLEE
jgi:ketosteroid isomerase-like protein